MEAAVDDVGVVDALRRVVRAVGTGAAGGGGNGRRGVWLPRTPWGNERLAVG